VLAQSFSRTFFRNAINNGLIPVQCDTSQTSEGDRLSVRLDGGRIGVTNHSSGRTSSGEPLPGIMLEILESGGLMAYIRGRGRWPVQER
jgi:3-isopropylmalate/(R)-2-methylmalate dehydratase small subunit